MEKIIQSFLLKSFVVISIILVSTFSCNKLEIEDIGKKEGVESSNKIHLGSLTVSEAEAWYKNTLLKTPNLSNSARSSSTIGQTGHPTEKNADFRFSFTAKVSSDEGNIVVAPLSYVGLKDLVYVSGESEDKGKNLEKKKLGYLNNLILYKQKDGSISSYIMRVIPSEANLKKNKHIVSGKDFSGEIQYFDWNEKFVTGHVYENGKTVARITSISNGQETSKNSRQSCQWVQTSTCYYYYVCQRDSNGNLTNCGEQLFNGCYVTNTTCVDVNDPPSGFSVPSFMNGGGGGNPGGFDGTVAILDASSLARQLEANPFSLLFNPTDCPQNVAAWVELARFLPESNVKNRIYSFENNWYTSNWNFQFLGDAWGTVVNCDNFSVKVNSLPSNFANNPSGFLNYIRQNINSFVNTDISQFSPHPNISGEANKWINDPLGAVMFIQIPLNNGSVVVSDYSSDHWTFTTITDPYAGSHPVSGNRQFGYIQNGDGSYTFYTKGVDRVRTRLEEIGGQALNNSHIPKQFDAADNLWISFVDKVQKYAQDHGGSAQVLAPVRKRPDWYEVRDVLTGQKPASSINCK